MAQFTLNKATANTNIEKKLVVVEDFYENPDYVRNFALQQQLLEHKDYHKGHRTEDRFFAPHMQEVFENILGKKINNWYNGDYCNGVFQYVTKNDPEVFHIDVQDWGGIIYLTPDAPYGGGTSFYASKLTGHRHEKQRGFSYDKVFPELPSGEDPFLDKTRFEKVDEVGNVYNRLVLFDARLIHSGVGYFGDNAFNSRLFHLFFFDVDS
jgi:hypothetical protein|tara:strand:- start:3010 stop:3636 length:627 start_codon:yes stop_codon:yes gene_type:complete